MASPQLPHEVGLELALRRVADGWVTVAAPDRFADHRKPFPDILTPFLRELIDDQHARIGGQRVRITESGLALLAEFRAKGIPNE